MGEVIAVLNQKGGTAKTTTAATLMEYFGIVRKRPTLAIDFDGQMSLSRLLNAKDGPSILDVLEGRVRVGDAAQQRSDTLFLVPAHRDLYKWTFNADGAEALRRVLQGAKDFVTIIDCGPAWTALSQTALAAATYLVIPCQPSVADIMGLQGLWHNIHGYDMPSGVVVTRVKGRTRLHRDALAALKKSPFKVFRSMIDDSVVVQEAINEGRSVITYKPTSKVGKQYRALAEEVEKCLTM